jgi:hypothetical protein
MLNLYIFGIRRRKKVKLSSEEIWPKIPTTEIKYHCLNEFKKAMSNEIVHQSVCAICASLYYKLKGFELNIAKIPNQHLLYPNDEMPSCVIRISVDINTTNGNVHMTGYPTKY